MVFCGGFASNFSRKDNFSLQKENSVAYVGGHYDNEKLLLDNKNVLEKNEKIIANVIIVSNYLVFQNMKQKTSCEIKNLEASGTSFSSSLFIENTEIKSSSKSNESLEFLLSDKNSSNIVDDFRLASLSRKTEKMNNFFKNFLNFFSPKKLKTLSSPQISNRQSVFQQVRRAETRLITVSDHRIEIGGSEPTTSVDFRERERTKSLETFFQLLVHEISNLKVVKSIAKKYKLFK